MSRHFFKSLCLLIAICIMVLTAIAGCGSKAGVNPGNSSIEETKATDATSIVTEQTTQQYSPMKVSWAFRGPSSYMSAEVKEYLTKKMKDNYNVDLVVEFIEKNVYEDKVNVMIASDQASDLVILFDRNKLIQGIESNYFKPVTNAVKSDPYFGSLDPECYALMTFNGEYYSVPQGGSNPEAIYYRADWAKKLNLTPPTNTEEMYQFAKAFTEGDPDGNGNKDTIGFAIQGDLKGAVSFWRLFTPNIPAQIVYLDPNDDTIKSEIYLKEDQITALSWLKKAYAEGVLDKEFVTMKTDDVQNKFITGKTGLMSKVALSVKEFSDKAKANNPNAEVAVLPAIKGKYGFNYTSSTSGASNTYVTKNCADPDRAIRVIMEKNSPEVSNIEVYGLPGVHYELKDGNFKWLDAEKESKYNPYGIISSIFRDQLKLYVPDPVSEQAISAIKDFEPVNQMIPIYTGASTVYREKITDIEKILLEFRIKAIIGEIEISDVTYDKMLGEMKKAGLDDVLTDLNTVYKQMK